MGHWHNTSLCELVSHITHHLTRVVPTLSGLAGSYFHLTVSPVCVTGREARGLRVLTWRPGTPTMELSSEPPGDSGDPGTATVMVVSWSGSPGSPPPSLMVSVAIFDLDVPTLITTQSSLGRGPHVTTCVSVRRVWSWLGLGLGKHKRILAVVILWWTSPSLLAPSPASSQTLAHSALASRWAHCLQAAGRGKAWAVARPGLSMCHLWPWGHILREALGHATCHLTCTLICILLASLALFSLLKIVFSQFKCRLRSGQAQVTPLCPQLSRPRSSDAFTSPISSGRRVESLSVPVIGWGPHSRALIGPLCHNRPEPETEIAPAAELWSPGLSPLPAAQCAPPHFPNSSVTRQQQPGRGEWPETEQTQWNIWSRCGANVERGSL